MEKYTIINLKIKIYKMIYVWDRQHETIKNIKNA